MGRRIMFFDTYALIEFDKGNPTYARFSNEVIFTSALNIAELYGYYAKLFGETKAQKLIDELPAEILMISVPIAIIDAKFKLKNSKTKFSWADAIGYELAKEHKMKFVTGDREFQDLPNVEFVK
jgi:uncharacterized protein